MKTIQQSTVAALLCVLVIIMTSACTHPLTEQVFKSPQAEFDLLIAGDASDYKDVLRGAIVQRYQTGTNIRVINIETLGKISPEDFDAILIMNTCLAWTRFNPTVLSFLKQTTAKDRVVWFMTVDDTEERYQHNGVDAITAASVLENQQGVITRLTQQIDAILSDTH